MPTLEELIKSKNKEVKEEVVTIGLPSYDCKRIPFTSPRMNYCTFGGLPVGKLVEFYGEEHGGKAVVNGTPVLTDRGWRAIETLRVGDMVFGEDGLPHRVLGVYPQGVKPCYEIELRDGCTVQCSGDHLWSVYTDGQMKHLRSRNCALRTMTTADLVDGMNNHRQYFLPSVQAMQYSGQVLKIDPYLLGLLLGDGGLTDNITFTNPEQDLVEQVRILVEQYGCELHHHAGIDIQWYIAERSKSNHHPLKALLKEYGLHGKHSRDKFIPAEYKFASLEDRIKLIAGMLNTDGSGDGMFEWESTSGVLVRDMWEVCMSSGIQCTYKIYADGHGKVRIPNASMPDELVSLLSEKHKAKRAAYVDNMKQVPHKYYRKIQKIVRIADSECTCIKVDNPSHLFITKDFIPTHNTTTALDIIANYQQMDDARKVLYVDAENTLDTEWARKLGVDVDDLVVFKPTSQSAEEILQFILDAVETGEVGLWVLDSIGVLASQQELGKTLEEKTYAGVSGPMTVFGRKAEMLMQRHKCTGIGINQLRDDMNAMYAGATKTPGGRGWKHYCAVRMQFTRGKFIDAKGNELTKSAESPAGNYVVMSMTKNKCCPPTRRTGFYTLNYEFGIDYLKDLVEVAMKYGVITKAGAWFSIVDPSTGELIEKLQGMSGVYAYLEDPDHEVVLAEIENYIDNQIYG